MDAKRLADALLVLQIMHGEAEVRFNCSEIKAIEVAIEAISEQLTLGFLNPE